MTPIADLMTFLLSKGLSPGDTAEAVRIVEAAIAAIATRGVSPEQRREKWRLKKAAQRAKRAGPSPGTPELDIESSSIRKDKDSLKKERKKDSLCPPVSGDTDDEWPADYEKQFWENFPKKRRYDKPQVMALLAKMRRERSIEWAVLFDGVLRYAASDPGEYAKAPLPWLRGHRWEGDYGRTITTGGTNGEQHNRAGGGASDAILAAARRRAGAMRGVDSASGRSAPVSPPDGMEDGRGGPRRGEERTFDLDLGPRR